MLEGDDIENWWDWKNTLGPLRNRPGFQNTWGYQQTDGLGLMEYLEFAEDMGTEMSTSSILGRKDKVQILTLVE